MTSPNADLTKQRQNRRLIQFTTEDGTAVDAYLKIKGITGQSEDNKHRQWIEASNVHTEGIITKTMEVAALCSIEAGQLYIRPIPGQDTS